QLSGPGVMHLDPSGASSMTSVVSALTFAGGMTPTGGKLDLSNERFVVDYTGQSPMPLLMAAVQAAFSGGSWQGAVGITSSAAVNNPVHYAVGIAEGSNLGLSSFGDYVLLDPNNPGAAITAVLMRYTISGDANLD